MNRKAGAQISKRAFLQSLIILFILMLLAGVLTRIVQAGQFTRIQLEDRETIDPASYQIVPPPDYPVWRWFTAPVEVLLGPHPLETILIITLLIIKLRIPSPFAAPNGLEVQLGPDALTIIVIIVTIFLIGGSFAVLDKSGLMKAALGRVVKAFAGRKYQLLLAVSFVFMAIGAFFGIFEEVVLLVPVTIALSYSLGWDALTGLGMSILATNMGFSAAVTNPFTIGVSQKIAELPLYSGAWLRILIFLVIYVVFAYFLLRHARRIERKPETSPVYAEDLPVKEEYVQANLAELEESGLNLRRAGIWSLVFLVLILVVLFSGPFLPDISDIALPLIGLLFFVGGIGAALLAGCSTRLVGKALVEGFTGIAPAVPLILMAASIKYIVASGGILDTILFTAAKPFVGASSFVSALAIYFLALIMELFIASGSAKAFLMMPILVPIADLVEVTRQTTVTAYCFGDGFANLAYPTNPVLLISLGLTVVSFPKWLRWTLPLWGMVFIVTVIFLGIAVAIGYGPF